MLLDPLPPVLPEAPTSAARASERTPEAEDESFAEHLPDEVEETEAPRPQATKPQDALVNWAALLPTAATQAQPQPTIDAAAAPAENVAAVTPIAATPTDFEAPQVVPTTPAPETTAPATAAPEALPQSAAATSEPVTAPVRAETSAPTATQATATPADAEPTVDSEQKTATPTGAAPQSTQTAQPTQTAEPEAAPEPDQPAVQPQQAPPPALALFTAPQPVAQRPQQQHAQTEPHQPTEEIAPLRADRPDAAAKQAAPNAPRPDQQGQPQNVAAAQPNQSAPRESAPPQQQQAPAPPPIDTSAAPPPASVASAEAARAQPSTASPAPAQRAASPASQVAQQIVRRIENGSTTFDLRLDPPELGRVDVRLEMSRDHQVVAHITADDAAALQQLVRSAREIEHALQSAGLELTQNGLSFDLADRGAAQSQDREAPRLGAVADATNTETPAAPARALMLERWRGARVDLTA